MGRKSNLRKKFGRLKVRDEGEASGTRNDNRTKNADGERITDNNLDDQDRISRLPERVLANILERLEIEEAVRTSVLSKIWIHKWTHICKPVFCDGFPFPKMNFLNFVEMVLKKISNMKEFNLFCFHKQDPSRVRGLISSALNSSVLESLVVALPLCTKVYFSPSFFNCNSLTKLVLKACSFSVSARVCFNHLRSLDLFGVEFQNQESSSSNRLLFMLPMLEDFKLDFCTFFNVKCLKIRAPLLSSLVVKECNYGCSISGTQDQCVIEINGGSNIKFAYVGALDEKFVFSKPSSVTNTEFFGIHVRPVGACRNLLEELGSRACLLLESFAASLKMLLLSEDVVMVLAHWLPDVRFSVFENLKMVEVPLVWFVSHCLHTSAIDFLKNAPVLEFLTISSLEHRVSRKCNGCKSVVSRSANYAGISRLAPNFLSHLKFLKFEIYHGWDEEIQLVKFLLLVTPVLEELRVVCKGQAVAYKLEILLNIFRAASPKISIGFVVLE